MNGVSLGAFETRADAVDFIVDTFSDDQLRAALDEYDTLFWPVGSARGQVRITIEAHGGITQA